MIKSRFLAALIHLVLSTVIVGSVVLFVLLVWYPGLYFKLAGAEAPMLLLVGVDMVLGPLMTLIVYKQGKASLKFDLTVIALIQAAALIYGVWALSSQRPEFLVFDRGSYEVISAADLKNKEVPDEINLERPMRGPKMVWAAPSDDPTLMLSVIIEGAEDIYLQPAQYRPIERAIQQMKASGHELTEGYLSSNPDVGEALDNALADANMTHEEVAGMRLYQVNGLDSGCAALTDPNTAELLFMLDVRVSWVRPDVPKMASGQGEQPIEKILNTEDQGESEAEKPTLQ